MIHLLAKIDPNLWTQFSGFLFSIYFIAIIFWVYSPKRKAKYSEAAQLPLKSD